jgi:hypothetical protein
MENAETNDMNTRAIADDPSPRTEGKERRPLMSRILQVVVLTVVIVGAGLVFAFFSQDATAAPSVSWSPISVSETLLPGESRTATVIVTAREAVLSATLWVVPELQPYVSVTPTSIGPLAKGETTSLSLSITVPIDAIPHTATGTVQFRQTKEPSKTIAQPLPVSVDVVWPQITLEGGLQMSHPPSWTPVTQSFFAASGQPNLYRITFNNGTQPTEFDEVDSQTASSLMIDRLVEVNQSGLSVHQWFDTYFDRGFPNPLLSREVTAVNGYPMLRVTVTELGGVHAHHYFVDGPDIIDISYGLFAPSLVPIYESITRSLRLSQ